ncbi:MAG: AhpC/TSA family protein [Mediterranea sp.]|jgi:peroxiredoxin|nr:AhpC/TSA family protein [Mediterranea sp.]
MKKLTYLFIATAAGIMASCGTTPGYTLTGTVEGAKDGDVVYLQEATGRSFEKLDSAVIKNGTFTFKGRQDTVVNRYLACQADGKPLLIDFFLENGNINVALTQENDSATGTPNNDIYQGIRSQMSDLQKQMEIVYTTLGDTALTDGQRAAEILKTDSLETLYAQIMKESVQKNITNPVGVYLFKQTFYENKPDENAALLAQLTDDAIKADEALSRIQEMTAKQQKTAVGTKFIDFEMPNPEGKMVKLSDYVGKGKLVLVDFWASWCGPCRREMPNLVEAYKQYKDKGFEIVGVSLDRDAASWKKGIKDLGITWPQMSDVKFWQNAAAQLYAVNSIPHTILIDGDGTIIARGLHGEEIQAKLAELLK